MSESTDGPCQEWATLADLELCSGCSPDAEIEPVIREDALSTASFVLYELSGRQYPGVCSSTVRPCRTGGSWFPYGLDYGDIWGYCTCGAISYSSCGCGGLQEISLGQPIISITSVKVDGVTLAASDYRVDNYNSLVRVDGEPWPSVQDLSLASTEDNTFEVTFTHGRSIPTAGNRAASRLACELARSYAGQSCKLPERVQSITRQGMSMIMLDPFDFLSQGKTGIYEVDLFLASVNRHGRTQRAQIASPDVGKSVRRVGT